MEEAIKAYRHVTATEEFKEIERLRSRALHNEASALGNARREGEQIGEKRADKKWQRVVANKDAVLANKDATLAEQAALIAELQARLGKGT